MNQYSVGQEVFAVFTRPIGGHKVKYLSVNSMEGDLVRFKELEDRFFVRQGEKVLQEIGNHDAGVVFGSFDEYYKILHKESEERRLAHEIEKQLNGLSVNELQQVLALVEKIK